LTSCPINNRFTASLPIPMCRTSCLFLF